MNIARINIGGKRTVHAVVEADRYRIVDGSIFGNIRLTDERIPKLQATLLAPVVPPQVVAIGLNYRKHAQESNMAVPTAPVVFIKTCNAVVGPRENQTGVRGESTGSRSWLHLRERCQRQGLPTAP
jgi:2-keto-4-pentenoate hydratase/2-oxohepta-3-ene-1,7-dioic acid hydratase in catechol pathway